MGLLDLFIAALTAVLKVLLLTAVGSFLAIDRVGLLGEDARKHLNRIVFFVFNPALVGSNLAKTITMKSLVMLWFMPLNILFTFILGSLLGLIVIKAAKAPNDLKGLVLGCCAAGNLGLMPLIIIPAVCKEKGSPFGPIAACHARGLSYATLSMAIGAIYMWSYVYNLVRLYSRKSPQATKIDNSTTTISIRETSENISKCPKGQLLPLTSSTSEDHFELENAVAGEKTEVSVLGKIKQRLKKWAVKMNLKHMLAPSTAGAIVGFIIGLAPPFRKAFIGDRAPLRVLEDSALILGDAAIPTVSLIVGANLLKGIKGSLAHLRLVIGIILVRYVALPMLGVLIVKGAVHFHLVKPDPLYQFVLMLQFALPPAINIGTMTQLFGVRESECSVIMLWTYVSSSISLTLWSTFFMWLVS